MTNQRTAVVTGAAGGLGSAFAHRLARDGYGLLLTDSNTDRLDILADDLRRSGARVRHISANLANEQDVDRLVEAISLDDTIQLLINNAGFGLVCKFQSVAIDLVIDMVHVHITASLRLCRAVLPQMLAMEGGGLSMWRRRAHSRVSPVTQATSPARPI